MIGATVGSYRIIGVLGKGGIGVVYTAEHNLIGRRAAVKVLNASYSQDEPMVQRFFNEARASSMIKHPGIVDVFDFGYHEDGSAYIIMDLLEGESLGARIDREHQLPERTVVSIVRRLASALAAAHKNGIIHRDLKPDNVFLAQHPEAQGGIEVKVLDFGVAKLVKPGLRSRVTQSGALLGTPLYMSPEQCRGAESVDQRSDVYSLGCIVYEMLTGQTPFRPQSMMDLLNAHVEDRPRPPRELEPSVSPALEALILKMLAKRPGDRPQTMDEVVAALADLEAGRAPATSVSTTHGGRTVRGPSRLPLVLGGVALVAAVAVAVVLVQRRPQAPAPQPPPPSAPARAVAPVVEPMRVRHVVESQPSGADVLTENGQLLGRTPFVRELPPSDTMAVYVVRLQGYRDARVELAGNRDDRATAAPTPLAAADAGAARPPRKRPKAETRGADDPVDPFK